MTKGRHTKATSLDGRRCSDPENIGCKKLAKDMIDGKRLCRKCSPMREHMIKGKDIKKAGKKKGFLKKGVSAP